MKRVKAVVLSVLVAALACLVLAGCGSQTPSQVVDNELKAVQEGKFADATAAIGLESSSEETLEDVIVSELEKQLETTLTDEQKKVVSKAAKVFSDFEYTLGEEVIDGDSATVSVHFVTHDLSKAVNKVYDDMLAAGTEAALSGKSEEQVQKAIVEALVASFDKQLDAVGEKSTERDAAVTLKKSGSSWVIEDLSQEGLDALFSGLLGALESVE